MRYAFESLLGGQAGYLFFIPAILIGSALGGWGPGIFATVLGMLVGALFVADYGSFTPANQFNVVVFALVGIGASWRGDLLRRAPLGDPPTRKRPIAREAHLQSILDTIPDAMVVIDERGTDAVVQHGGGASVRLWRGGR